MSSPIVPAPPSTTSEIDPADAALARTLESELSRQAQRSRPALGRLKPALSRLRYAPAPSPSDPQTLGRWTLALALLNIVLSGFILVFWGVPQWEARSAQRAGSAQAGVAVTSGSPAAAQPSTSTPAAGDRRGTDVSRDSRYRIDPNATVQTPTATSAASASRTASPPRRGSGAPPAAPASSSGATSPSGATRPSGAESRSPPASAAATSRGANSRPSGAAPTETSAKKDAAPATRSPAPVELSGASSENALATVQAAPVSANAGAGGIAVAGEAGVTMPERLAESYVQPRIATMPGAEPVTGEVRLVAVVRTDGSVQDLSVLSSSRRGAGLEEAALDAVRRWRYKPATRDGTPVDARLTITVTFR
jgi:periplasmic protein TonB